MLHKEDGLPAGIFSVVSSTGPGGASEKLGIMMSLILIYCEIRTGRIVPDDGICCDSESNDTMM